MPAVLVAHGLGRRGRHQSCRRDQRVDSHVHRPVGHDRRGENGGHGNSAARGFRPPGNGNRRNGEDDEGGQRDGIMPAREDKKRGDQEVDREREAREAVDFARLGRRPVEQSAYQERGGKRETGERVEHVRSERRDGAVLHSRQRPCRAERDRRHGKPLPQSRARQRERGRGDNGDVDVERPIIGLGRGDQHRRYEGADDTQAGERRAVQQGRCQRQQRHHAEQEKGNRGRQESVERIGGVHRGVGHRGAGGGQHAWNMRRRDAGKAG